jgi:nicotinamidase/pyrazinamidase
LTKALVVVNMQNDFMPGGALVVKGASEIVQPILQLMSRFSHRIALLNWHPKNYIGFAANHPGKKVGDTILIRGQLQHLWPVHCLQNTHGADLAQGFKKEQFEAVFHNGATALKAYLHTHHITHITFVGLAFDYSIFYSALEARRDGVGVAVITKLCRSIDPSPAREQETIKILKLYGVDLTAG